MDTIDDMFRDGTTLYPGSRRVRKSQEKSPAPVPTDEAFADLMDPATWGIPPVRKTIKGKKMTLYTFGSLAAALQRPVITVKLWEKEGRIPAAPFRAEHISGPGGRVGRRYYSQRSINNAQIEFYNRGLLGTRRIDWSLHEDLTEAIAQKWHEEITEFLASTEKGETN